MLDVVASYRCMQFQGKIMNHTLENGKKKLTLNLFLARLAQIWAPKCFFVGFTFATFLGRKNFIFKNLALSVTRYNGQLLSCTISEKTNDPILRKFSDGETDRQIDRRE